MFQFKKNVGPAARSSNDACNNSVHSTSLASSNYHLSTYCLVKSLIYIAGPKVIDL